MAPGVLGLWSLGNAAMLAWGGAAAIPLLIHLWSRRHRQEIPWAAMQFLLAALQKHSRRLRLEQLVLLAVRMLLLLVLAVALADPLWSWSAANLAAPTTGATHYVLVVDTSFSMAFRERDQTHLQVAQDHLRQLLERSREGDGFSLVLLERSPRPIIAEVGFDRGEVLRQIERLQVSHGGANLAATLTIVEPLLTQAQERYPRLERRRICLVTDLGQNTWSAALTAPVGETLRRLEKVAELVVDDVGLDDRANLAVTGLTGSPSAATPGEKVRFMAEVQSFGPPRSTTTRIEFLVNDRVVHAQDVLLAVGERQRVSWEQTFGSAGDQIVSARVAMDNLPVDNQRWLVVPVRPSLTVLAVEGEPSAAEFVALALNPDSQVTAPIQCTVAGENALLKHDLSTYDCLFLCNVGRLTSFEATALHQYVSQGGGLVISLGDQVQADHYNRELGEGPTAVLPARLGGIERGEQFFDPLEYRHPLVGPFRGRERAGLLTVPTWRHYRLEPVTPKNTSVALAFTNGEPAIVETQIGRGRCILVATALSASSLDRTGDTVTPWTALPAWPSFPPLVHGLLQTAIRGRGTERTVEVGSPLMIPGSTSPSSADRAVTVVRPDQQRERLSSDRRSMNAETVPQPNVMIDTPLCGVYHVEFAGTPPESREYAANLDPRESDLRRVRRSQLPESLRAVEQSEVASFSFQGDLQEQLFRPLLALVGLLLLAEQWLTVLFSRRPL